MARLNHERPSLESAEHCWRVLMGVRTPYHGRTPTVAAVNGPALGASGNFALASEICLTAEDAFRRTQFGTVGLGTGDCGTWLQSRLVGEDRQIHGATGDQQGHPLTSLSRAGSGPLDRAGTGEIQKTTIGAFLVDDGMPGAL